jgi:hypothetical protein
MILGFTGTSYGMSSAQLDTVFNLFKGFKSLELHHGDCVGADAQAHSLACTLLARIVIHPPSDSRQRAYCDSANLVHLSYPYLIRNKHIVRDGIDGLIATPFEYTELLRSGTWSTIRYARKLKRHIWIVFPDGSIREE